MKVSFVQKGLKTKNNNGFGYAREMCEKSIAELGHEVVYLDPTADVEINFIQPQHVKWSGCDYRVLYLPWESTTIPDAWVEAMNEVDEVWTPSPVIAGWYADAGVTKPIHVYEHGVDDVWQPLRRSTNGRFRVFHHGAEGLRKGGEQALAAFQRVLWDEYAAIVFKMVLAQFAIQNTHRMELHPGKYTIDELVSLYHSCNLMLYPSWGEGFGLTPLQAMATGMPVVITKGWAPYEHLLKEHNLIDSELAVSPWQDHHPGKMFKPDFPDLVDKLRYQWENKEDMAEEAFELSHKVHEEYSWRAKTEAAFAHLL